MADAKDRVAEYRRQAALCLQVAECVSIREHRERMREMARQWLVLAEEVEAKED